MECTLNDTIPIGHLRHVAFLQTYQSQSVQIRSLDRFKNDSVLHSAFSGVIRDSDRYRIINTAAHIEQIENV